MMNFILIARLATDHAASRDNPDPGSHRAACPAPARPWAPGTSPTIGLRWAVTERSRSQLGRFLTIMVLEYRLCSIDLTIFPSKVSQELQWSLSTMGNDSKTSCA